MIEKRTLGDRDGAAGPVLSGVATDRRRRGDPSRASADPRTEIEIGASLPGLLPIHRDDDGRLAVPALPLAPLRPVHARNRSPPTGWVSINDGSRGNSAPINWHPRGDHPELH